MTPCPTHDHVAHGVTGAPDRRTRLELRQNQPCDPRRLRLRPPRYHRHHRPLSASHPPATSPPGSDAWPCPNRAGSSPAWSPPPAPDPDTQRTLNERVRRIETRASHVLADAIRQDEPWTRSLSKIPDDPVRRAAWLRATITIAAYRGRYLITDGTVGDSPHMDPLGVSPASTDHQTQADDHQRARRALLPC